MEATVIKYGPEDEYLGDAMDDLADEIKDMFE